MLKLKKIEKKENKYFLFYEKNNIECIISGNTKEQVINDFFRLSNFTLIKFMQKYISNN